MKEKRSFISAVITGLLLLLFLPACVVSQHPLSPAEKGRTPGWIEGKWIQIDGNEIIVIERIKGTRAYNFDSSTDSEKSNTVHLTKIGRSYIMNMKLDLSESNKKNMDKKTSDLKEVYYLIQLQKNGSNIILQPLDQEYFFKLIQEGELQGDIEEGSSGNDGVVVLRDEPGILRKAVKRYLKEGIVHDDRDVYKRMTKNE